MEKPKFEQPTWGPSSSDYPSARPEGRLSAAQVDAQRRADRAELASLRREMPRYGVADRVSAPAIHPARSNERARRRENGFTVALKTVADKIADMLLIGKSANQRHRRRLIQSRHGVDFINLSETHAIAIDRRSFLKMIGRSVGAVILGQSIGKLFKFTGQESAIEELPVKQEENIDLEISQPVADQPTGHELGKHQIRFEKGQLRFDDKEYVFDEVSYKSLLSSMIKRFNTPGLPLCESFRQSFRDISAWMPKMKKPLFEAYEEKMGTPGLTDRFADQDCRIRQPHELAYVSIAESNFDFDRVSRAGAAGPYQFMPETATDYDLKTTPVIDERRDPIKSGQAAIRALCDIYKKFGDWDLALCGYNSSFVWDYYYHARAKQEKMSHQGYLKYLVSRINKEKKALHNGQAVVRRGDNVARVAERFRMRPEELMRMNRLRSKELKEGSLLTVKVDDKQLAFRDIVGGYQENIQYAFKMRAIMYGVNSGLDAPNVKPVEFHEVIIRHPEKGVKNYLVKAGDSLYGLAKRFGLTPDSLSGYNKLPKGAKLAVGHELKIPAPDKTVEKDGRRINPLSLRAHARNPEHLRQLRSLNPAIAQGKEDASLPDKYILRII